MVKLLKKHIGMDGKEHQHGICEICGNTYADSEKAYECESSGKPEPKYRAGQKLKIKYKSHEAYDEEHNGKIVNAVVESVKISSHRFEGKFKHDYRVSGKFLDIDIPYWEFWEFELQKLVVE